MPIINAAVKDRATSAAKIKAKASAAKMFTDGIKLYKESDYTPYRSVNKPYTLFVNNGYKDHLHGGVDLVDASVLDLIESFNIPVNVFITDRLVGAHAQGQAVAVSNGTHCDVFMGPTAIVLDPAYVDYFTDNPPSMFAQYLVKDTFANGAYNNLKYYKACLYHELVHCHYYIHDFDNYATLLEFRQGYNDVEKCLGRFASASPIETIAEYYTFSCHGGLRASATVDQYVDYLSDVKLCAHKTTGSVINLSPLTQCANGEEGITLVDRDYQAYVTEYTRSGFQEVLQFN